MVFFFTYTNLGLEITNIAIEFLLIQMISYKLIIIPIISH